MSKEIRKSRFKRLDKVRLKEDPKIEGQVYQVLTPWEGEELEETIQVQWKKDNSIYLYTDGMLISEDEYKGISK